MIHESASKGYAIAAETYAHGRPDYPSDVVDWLKQVIGIDADCRVLEVGAGTGKFIPVLHQCSPAALLALEPVDAMRSRLTQAHPKVQALAGTAASIPLQDESVGAIVCAQAFHWFATAAALAEMRRVLRTGGMLGLVWNVRDESVPWVAALSELTDPWESGTPRFRTGSWRNAFPAEGFQFVGQRHASNSHVGSAREVILNRTLSVSFIAALPPEKQQQISRQVEALISSTPELAGSAEVAFPYKTEMFAYRKIA
jgi:ubiquinone/menaquinone biosynthesis C-methylase UbiE